MIASCGGGAVIDCINPWGASSKIKKRNGLDLRGEIAIYEESSRYTAITCTQVVGQDAANWFMESILKKKKNPPFDLHVIPITILYINCVVICAV